jgi:hypothetical protein
MGHDEATPRVALETKGTDKLTDFADFSMWPCTRASPTESIVSPDVRKDGEGAPMLCGRWTRRLVQLSALWALVEFPVEYWGAQDGIERIALSVSTALWLFIIIFVLKGNSVARVVYVFLCALGVLAVAPALPAEYTMFPLAFYLSFVECVVKCLMFVTFVSRYISEA